MAQLIKLALETAARESLKTRQDKSKKKDVDRQLNESDGNDLVYLAWRNRTGFFK